MIFGWTSIRTNGDGYFEGEERGEGEEGKDGQDGEDGEDGEGGEGGEDGEDGERLEGWWIDRGEEEGEERPDPSISMEACGK